MQEEQSITGQRKQARKTHQSVPNDESGPYVYRPWSDVELTLAHVGEGLSFYPKKYPSRTQVLKKRLAV